MTWHERLERKANNSADLGKTTTEMLNLLQKTRRNMSVSCAIYLNGTVGLKMDVKTLKIKTALEGDSRLTITELWEVTDVSRGTGRCILANILNMKKDIYFDKKCLMRSLEIIFITRQVQYVL